MDNYLDKIRDRFEGKRVVRVEPPGISECIAKFVMDDGSSFYLCATDLGYWVQDAPGSDGCSNSRRTK